MSGATSAVILGAGIAAAGAIGSSYMQSRAQDKASRAQEEAARKNLELQKRQQSEQEQSNNRQMAAQNMLNGAAIADAIEKSPYGQLTGGSGISRDQLQLGTAATLGQNTKMGRNSTMGTRSRMGGSSDDNPFLL